MVLVHLNRRGLVFFSFWILLVFLLAILVFRVRSVFLVKK